MIVIIMTGVINADGVNELQELKRPHTHTLRFVFFIIVDAYEMNVRAIKKMGMPSMKC